METKPFQSNRSSYPTSSTRKQTILSLVVLPCLSTPNASSAQSQNHCEELSHLFLRSSAPQAIIDTMSLTCDSKNSTNVVGTTNSRPRTTASLWMVAAITSIWVFSTKVAITRNVHLQFYWLQQEKRLIYSRKDKTNVYPKGKKDISPRKYESMQLTGSQSFSPSQQTAFLHTHYWQSAHRQWMPEKQLGHAWQQVMPQPSALVH